MKYLKQWRERISDRGAYAMCKKKRKLKSNQAAKMASRFGQRKYLCPVCNGWHLTKDRGKNHGNKL